MKVFNLSTSVRCIVLYGQDLEFKILSIALEEQSCSTMIN